MEVDHIYQCMLQCGEPCDGTDSISKISQEKWDNIRMKSEGWRGLDKYGCIFDTTPCEKGPIGYYMHSSCLLTLSNKVKLQQAITRHEKIMDEKSKIVCSVESSGMSIERNSIDLLPKRRRSDGRLSDKTKCVWCFKGNDSKHPGRKGNKLSLI